MARKPILGEAAVCVCAFLSGTTSRMVSATAAEATARAANSPRQPRACTTASAGPVADRAPSAPSMMYQPLARATRSGGNHRTMALRPAIRPTATPRPIRARPTRSVATPSARANRSEPAAATRSRALSMSRGPYRSRSTPQGSCTAANVRKYMDVSRPRSAAVRPSSATRSPAISALMERNR
jgi:hypothetical protein